MKSAGLTKRVALAAVVLIAWGLLVPPALGSGDSATAETIKTQAPGSPIEAVLFYGIAAGTIVCALGVCISTNIVRMAVWLFGALACVAVLYFSLAATFIAAIQLIVYVGGTLILLVFGVMLTSKSASVRFSTARWELIGAGAVCVALLACLAAVFIGAGWTTIEGTGSGVAVADIGRTMITKYVVPFEVAGVLLMIVMVGAAHLARQEKK